jgi:hypothetical protein
MDTTLNKKSLSEPSIQIVARAMLCMFLLTSVVPQAYGEQYLALATFFDSDSALNQLKEFDKLAKEQDVNLGAIKDAAEDVMWRAGVEYENRGLNQLPDSRNRLNELRMVYGKVVRNTVSVSEVTYSSSLPLAANGMKSPVVQASKSSLSRALPTHGLEVPPLIQLPQMVAKVVNQDIDVVEQTLKLLSENERREAFLNRFYLRSPAFKPHFFKVWHSEQEGGPEDALRELATGLFSEHLLDPLGRLFLKEDELYLLPDEVVNELPPNLIGPRLFRSTLMRNQKVKLKWTRLPDLPYWIPISITVNDAKTQQLRVVFDKNKRVVKVGIVLTRKMLRTFGRGDSGFIIYTLVPPGGGPLRLGTDRSQHTKRLRGIYYPGTLRGHLIRATLGSDALVTQLWVSGVEGPHNLILAEQAGVKKGEYPDTESHIELHDPNKIYEDMGNFWTRGWLVGERPEGYGSLAIATPRLKIAGDELDAEDLPDRFYYRYVLPSETAGLSAEVLHGKSGVPVYISVPGKWAKFLKRLEVRTEQGTLLEVLDSASGSVRMNAIDRALKQVRALEKMLNRKLYLVVTQIPIQPYSGDRRAAGVGGETMVFTRATVPDLPNDAFAEVVYDSSDSDDSLKPIAIHLGQYSTADPNAFNARRFITKDDQWYVLKKPGQGKTYATEKPSEKDAPVGMPGNSVLGESLFAQATQPRGGPGNGLVRGELGGTMSVFSELDEMRKKLVSQIKTPGERVDVVLDGPEVLEKTKIVVDDILRRYPRLQAMNKDGPGGYLSGLHFFVIIPESELHRLPAVYHNATILIEDSQGYLRLFTDGAVLGPPIQRDIGALEELFEQVMGIAIAIDIIMVGNGAQQARWELNGVPASITVAVLNFLQYRLPRSGHWRRNLPAILVRYANLLQGAA